MAGDDPEAATKAAAAKKERRLQEVGAGSSNPVVRQIKNVGAAQFPMLTRTNYAEWSTIMKVMLRGRGLWAAVTTGPVDEQEDLLAMEAILKAVPPELVTPMGSADDATAKKAWEKLKTMRLGNEASRRPGHSNCAGNTTRSSSATARRSRTSRCDSRGCSAS
jgi:hypothetical protein